MVTPMTVMVFLLVSTPSSEPRYSPARAAAAPTTESPSAAISVVIVEARIVTSPLPCFTLGERSLATALSAMSEWIRSSDTILGVVRPVAFVRLDVRHDVHPALVLVPDDVGRPRAEVGERILAPLDLHAVHRDGVVGDVDVVGRAAKLAPSRVLHRRAARDREPEGRDQRRDGGSTHRQVSFPVPRVR